MTKIKQCETCGSGNPKWLEMGCSEGVDVDAFHNNMTDDKNRPVRGSVEDRMPTWLAIATAVATTVSVVIAVAAAIVGSLAVLWTAVSIGAASNVIRLIAAGVNKESK